MHSKTALAATPTPKQQRYDRQLRLWNEHGQQRLERARVLLICGADSACTAAGTEMLKNLVLPGVAFVAVLDEASVSEADLGANFFLTKDMVGKRRDKSIAESLKELNPDVQCDRSYYTLSTILGVGRLDYSLVCAVGLRQQSVLELATQCEESSIPLMVMRCSGFVGYLRVWSPPHFVIETHREPPALDLRLDCPWPELRDYCLAVDYNRLDAMELAHVPFVVLLIQALERWRSSHNGRTPQGPDERKLFRAEMEQHFMAAGGAIDAENLEEARKHVNRACTPTEIPVQIRAMFESDECRFRTGNRIDKFWHMVVAVRRFVGERGCLPLMGSLPDMKADTSSYIALQTLYRDKAVADRLIVEKNYSDSHYDPYEPVERFCRHFAAIPAICKYRSITAEIKEGPTVSQYLKDCKGSSYNLIDWYILFQAAEVFHERHTYYPGASMEKNYMGDVPLLKDCAQELLVKWKCQDHSVSDDFVREMCRAGGGELHNTAALMGGIASQECLKLLTRQYVPMQNTLIFDGMRSTTAVFDL